MSEPSFTPFHPEKIFRNGMIVVGSAFLLVGGIAASFWISSSPFFVPVTRPLNGKVDKEPLSFSFGMDGALPHLQVPYIESEISFSYALPRPDGQSQEQSLLVRFKKSMHSLSVALPARIDLQFEGSLSYSNRQSSFWLELSPLENRQIEGKVCLMNPDRSIESRTFMAQVQESPIRMPVEFPEGSPFRALAEGRWGGHDLFREAYGRDEQIERIEVGAPPHAEIVELRKEEWVVWEEGRWRKMGALEEGKERPIAHIEQTQEKTLILEGWDANQYVRVALPLVPAQPFRAKGEELFSAIRIRSEKQVSCMLEKQCMILKMGDWVLKEENRWKILRKPEEKEACLKGALSGEIFVFDQIEIKGGQKMMRGKVFNASHSQMLPIEIAVSERRSARSESPGMKKTKGKR